MNEEPTAIDDAFDSIDQVFAAWVAEAGGRVESNVWLTPQSRVKLMLPKARTPQILVSRLLRDKSTGQYMARAMNWPFLLKLKGTCRRLALPICDRTVKRLILAGFVRGAQITNGIWLVDVESLHDHLMATSGPDADLFWTPARKARYSEVISRDRRGSDKRRGHVIKKRREKPQTSQSTSPRIKSKQAKTRTEKPTPQPTPTPTQLQLL